jgi:hypothetical protein
MSWFSLKPLLSNGSTYVPLRVVNASEYIHAFTRFAGETFGSLIGKGYCIAPLPGGVRFVTWIQWTILVLAVINWNRVL